MEFLDYLLRQSNQNRALQWQHFPPPQKCLLRVQKHEINSLNIWPSPIIFSDISLSQRIRKKWLMFIMVNDPVNYTLWFHLSKVDNKLLKPKYLNIMHTVYQCGCTHCCLQDLRSFFVPYRNRFVIFEAKNRLFEAKNRQ